MPRPTKNESLPKTTTRLPSCNGTGERRSRSGSQVTDSDMSADGSRSTRKAVRAPGRRVIWVICPSTQTLPSRSIHWESLRATVRTGQGDSAELAGAGAGAPGRAGVAS